MDFFARQDKARRNTRLLVFYFLLAVIFLILAVYVAVAVTFTGIGVKNAESLSAAGFSQPVLFLCATVGTLVVISSGSLFKTLQLARGGSAVAELLEGRLINANTREANERKLLNVVEEMAIASGVPVPQVYVMDNEPGINAFAAGHSSGDAVISVTRGCMTLLSRDELQGVIGHEFSHILNGDMRLNLRLIGLIFGILCLTIIGRILIRTRGKKNPLPLLGLALIIIGWAGVVFGRLIQAAVSRQREVLADASSVQFTRNPAGLAGALKKIGGLAEGSRLNSPHAEEASHLFFANGMGNAFFKTHPPLVERIRELDPTFDGKFPPVVIPDATAEAAPESRATPPPTPPPIAGFQKIPGIIPAVIAQTELVANIGRPTPQHLRYAVEFTQTVPSSFEEATRDPLTACALVCAFLLDDNAAAREKQLDELSRVVPESLRAEVTRLWPAVENVPPHARIPLIDLALPSLRALSPQQFHQFRVAKETLMASDRETDLFEYMLQKVVTRHLETHFSPAQKPITQFYALSGLVDDCGVLLSATAHAGHEDTNQAQAAFAHGAELLGRAAQNPIPWLPPDQCNFSHLDRALERLSQAVPQIKKNVLNACAQTVAADGVIQEREAEILRAIADALDCPVPPFVQPISR